MLDSSSGKDIGFSSQQQEFDSPIEYHKYADVAQRQSNRLISDRSLDRSQLEAPDFLEPRNEDRSEL